MSAKIIVSGVGMTPFLKPGTSPDYDAMGEAAIREALTDAGASYDLIQQAYAGYVYGDSTAGQRTVYRVGLTGIPVIDPAHKGKPHHKDKFHQNTFGKFVSKCSLKPDLSTLSVSL